MGVTVEHLAPRWYLSLQLTLLQTLISGHFSCVGFNLSSMVSHPLASFASLGIRLPHLTLALNPWPLLSV